MEIDPKKLKDWWDKIAPEDKERIVNRNNSFDFLSDTKKVIKPPPISQPVKDIK